MKKVFLVVLLSLHCLSANALVELDQSFTEGLDRAFSVSGKAQTFTVGKSGLLSNVSMGIYNTGFSTTFYLLPVVSGVPVADFSKSLASANVSNLSYPNQTWLDVDLRPFNIPVKQGDQLAIALYGDTMWAGDLEGKTGYAKGKAFERNFYGDNTEWYWNDFGGNRDYHFKTFVDDGSNSVVPEPSTILLLGGGLAGAIWRRRKVSKT